MNKGFMLATGLLAGTIIGAGVFSLPYVFSRLGLLTGFFYLAAFTAVYFIIHRMYAQVLELNSEDGNHQFFYLAHKYFGRPLANLSSFVILSELIFVMLVYLVLAPAFIGLIFNGSAAFYLLVFWLLGSIFIFARLTLMSYADFLGTLAILGIVALVFLTGSDAPLTTPLFNKLDLKIFFLPFGPLLFSLAGRPAIHKVMEEYRKAKKEGQSFSLRKVIFWGTVIPAVVYTFFVISVLKLNPDVSPEALNSLSFLSPTLLGLLGIMGFITLWTSYFMIGANVKDILRLDIKSPAWLSALVVIFSPLFLYFLGFREFLFVVTFAGSVFLVLEALFVIFMWRSALPGHRWKWITWPLSAVFLAALIHEIATFL